MGHGSIWNNGGQVDWFQVAIAGVMQSTPWCGVAVVDGWFAGGGGGGGPSSDTGGWWCWWWSIKEVELVKEIYPMLVTEWNTAQLVVEVVAVHQWSGWCLVAMVVLVLL